MDQMSLQEAQLLRTLASVFGSEQVLYKMKVRTVCGGKLPNLSLGIELEEWTSTNECLFTVVDSDDEPKMVVEISGFESDSLDVTQMEHEQILKPLLEALDIHYITISADEFSEILNSNSSFDICSLLNHRLGINEASTQA